MQGLKTPQIKAGLRIDAKFIFEKCRTVVRSENHHLIAVSFAFVKTDIEFPPFD